MLFYFLLPYYILLFSFSGKQAPDFIAPPGTIKISENLFIDKGLNSNIDWAEFVFYRKNIEKLDVASLIPDSTMSTYFMRSNHTWDTIKKYDKEPTTGITYEQALEYCKWRSDIVTKTKNELSQTCNSCIKEYKKYKKCDPKHEYRIEYRLPTEEEWTLIYEKLKKDHKLNKTIIRNDLWEMLNGGKDVYFHSRQVRLDYPGPNINMGFRCVATYVKINP